MFLPLYISAISGRRDKACSLGHYGTKGGNCTGHGGHFFYNTIALQTLVETGAGTLFVKYVFLTSAQKTPKRGEKNYKDRRCRSVKPSGK